MDDMAHVSDRDCDCDQCRRVSDYIAEVLAEAPPLTPEQHEKLATLLQPVRIQRRAESD